MEDIIKQVWGQVPQRIAWHQTVADAKWQQVVISRLENTNLDEKEEEDVTTG